MEKELLHNNIWQEILLYVSDIKQVCSTRLVSKSYKAMIDDDYFWHRLVERDCSDCDAQKSDFDEAEALQWWKTISTSTTTSGSDTQQRRWFIMYRYLHQSLRY